MLAKRGKMELPTSLYKHLYKMFVQNSYSDVQVPVLTSLFLLINSQRHRDAFCWSYVRAFFTSPQESCAHQQIVWLEVLSKVMSSTLRTSL